MRRLLRGKRITAATPLDSTPDADRPQRIGDLSAPEVQASIGRALQILAARSKAPGYVQHELQPVVQVCASGEHYARWRKDRDRLLRRSSNGWSAAAWPERLGPSEVAIVLLPYPAGRVGPAVAASKVVYRPAFIDGRAESPEAVILLALQLVRLWLHMTPEQETLMLGPPVLEKIQRARVQRRSLLDCGAAAWPLAAPDGL